MAGKAKIEKVTMRIPCRVFGCGKPAKYRIGNPQGSPSGYYHLCKECTDSLITSILEVVDDNIEDNADINEVIEEVIEEVTEEEEVATEEVEVHYVWSEQEDSPEELTREVKMDEPKKPAPKKKLAKKGAKK
jgi:hypothetical protein